jgi:hypothetical protein
MAERMSKFWRAVLLFGSGMEEEEKAAALAQFITEVRRFFEAKGFTYNKAYQAFKRKEGDLIWTFGLGFSFYPDAYTVRPAASVRHEQIERLFHRVSCAPESVQRDSATVLWQRALEKRIPKPNSFSVDRASQVPRAVSFTERFFTKWVEPFFSAHSSLEDIDRSFNEKRALLRAKFVTDWFEMIGRAIIAAKLAHRPDYEDLKRDYRRALVKHWSQFPDREASFVALIHVLDGEV